MYTLPPKNVNSLIRMLVVKYVIYKQHVFSLPNINAIHPVLVIEFITFSKCTNLTHCL